MMPLTALLFLGLLTPLLSGATVLYVKPTEDTPCPPGEPCHTLDEYVRNTTTYFVSETTFSFLPGTHNLSRPAFVGNEHNLAMMAYNASADKPVVFCKPFTITSTDTTFLSFTSASNLTIHQLNFTHCGYIGEDTHSGALSFTNVSNIYISQVVFHRPKLCGISAWSVSGTLVVTEMYVKADSLSVSSGAVWITFDMPPESVSSLIISNSTFELLKPFSNYAPFMALAALNFSFPLPTKDRDVDIILENLVFHNSAGTAFGLLGPVPGLFELRNVSFINSSTSDFAVNSADVFSPSVYLEDVQHVSFIDCEFSGNTGTPIVAYNSNFTFSGTTIFSNNTAHEGGAIAFYGNSHMNVSANTHVIFRDNSAHRVGGAIFVRQEYIPTYGPHVTELPTCFFLIKSLFPPSNVSMSFINNIAIGGGDAIYGASLYNCLSCPQSYCFKLINSTIFQFEPSKDFSLITSDPARVCLCVNSTPDCTLVFNSEPPRYPGEVFHLSAVVVGDLFGTVDGLVYAQVLPQVPLGELQHSQQVKHEECNELSYSLLSAPGEVVLVLTASGVQVRTYPSENEIENIKVLIFYYKLNGKISHDLLTTPIYINITVLPCPPGFVLSNDPPHCICDPLLHSTVIECNITDQTVHRRGTTWVSALSDGNSSNTLTLSKHCPYYYCKQQEVAVNLTDPDIQCSFDHSGTLCGACQSGLSLALGSPQCLPCSDSYLALLIAFAIAGLTLVFVIKVLNLTVAVGTINGLIFYANIIQANRDTFFPAGDTNPLTVFIAWLNLDLGIETCFFDGLNGYIKTWLEFVFPLYIWTIVILIIILAHYSSTASKIFGSNSVPVLATLVLLSYAKLLRTIITVFSLTYLEYGDGNKKAVWSYDGNMDYLSPQHIPLFIVAIAVFLFLWAPYTVLLSFGQCIQRIAYYKVRIWIIRSKPFFDAYFGPLKDSHRYWVGLLLLARGLLFVVFSSTPTSDFSADLLATAIVVLSLVLYLAYAGHMYRRSYLTLLENSYIYNLGILAVGTLYIRLAGGNQAALVYTSVAIAFTQFIGTVLFHCLTLPKVKKLVVKFCPTRCLTVKEANLTAEYESLDRPDGEGEGGLEPIPVIQQRITYNEFREPVLKYVN